MTDYSCIIWDFNGTILDDVDTCIRTVNILLKERNLPMIESREAYYDVFGFPIIDYYSRLGFDFEKEPYDKIAVEWVDIYLKEILSAPMCPHVPEALERFRTLRIPQYILSATELNMLRYQVDNLGISDYFTKLYGLDNIRAASKLDLAALMDRELKPEHALVIGDTVHDAQAADGLGYDCVLISSGHNSRKELESTGKKVVSDVLEIFDM